MNDIAVPNYDNVLTEDSRQQTMTKHRKHGFKSAGNATRYSKVAAAQYLRWNRQNRPPDHDYFRSQHVHSGIAVRQLNSLLSELNIPTVYYKTINVRLKETGKIVEKVAKESTDEPLQNEVKAVEQTNGKFVVAVDAGWQKRGSGRSYDSLSGHCSMIGTQTRQIIHYAVRSKDCRVCSSAASRNEPPKPHD